METCGLVFSRFAFGLTVYTFGKKSELDEFQEVVHQLVCFVSTCHGLGEVTCEVSKVLHVVRI